MKLKQEFFGKSNKMIKLLIRGRKIRLVSEFFGPNARRQGEKSGKPRFLHAAQVTAEYRTCEIPGILMP